jgi:hypothetical protein
MNRGLTKEQKRTNEKRFRTLFLLHGIDCVQVSFDGSGDSGQIDDVAFFKNEKLFDAKSVDVTVFRAGDPVFDTKKKKWTVAPNQEVQMSLHEAIEHHVDLLLNESNVDWYNNDGGFGHWHWRVGEGVDFEVNQRIVQHNIEYSTQHELGEDEDEEEEDPSQNQESI